MAEAPSTLSSDAGEVGSPRVTGRRVLATILDGLVFLVLGIVLSALLGTASAGSGGVSFELQGWRFVVFLLLVLAYYVSLEGYFGATLGKRLLGIKVVRDGTNEAPGLGAAVLRNVLRFVDALPFLYLVGFVTVLANGKRKRLGDMAARTQVVRGSSSR